MVDRLLELYVAALLDGFGYTRKYAMPLMPLDWWGYRPPANAQWR